MPEAQQRENPQVVKQKGKKLLHQKVYVAARAEQNNSKGPGPRIPGAFQRQKTRTKDKGGRTVTSTHGCMGIMAITLHRERPMGIILPPGHTVLQRGARKRRSSKKMCPVYQNPGT